MDVTDCQRVITTLGRGAGLIHWRQNLLILQAQKKELSSQVCGSRIQELWLFFLHSYTYKYLLIKEQRSEVCPPTSWQMKGKLNALRKLATRKSTALSADENLYYASVCWAYFKDLDAEHWSACHAHIK